MNKIERILSGLAESQYEINTELEFEDDCYYNVASIYNEDGFVDSVVYYDFEQMQQDIKECKKQYSINY